MFKSSWYDEKIILPFLIANFLFICDWQNLVHAETTNGVGKLKFGMSPNEVESLEGCNSETECLYEILGKNRYFTLLYDGKKIPNLEPSLPSPTSKLTQINIDMGNHTKEWFAELYEAIVSQYSLMYFPTEQEKTQFEEGTEQELIIGFDNGSVLLKLVRRPFGNLILHVVYQDKKAAQAQLELWQQTSSKDPPH